MTFLDRATPAQADAITFDRHANLLVSAGAGSGKTSVLSQRIIARAKTGRVDLARLLVMTFTELAATQMKNKIEATLREALRHSDNAEETARLRRQLQRLPLAQISTIHAFCNRILSEYLAEYTDEDGTPRLEPGYRVLEDEALRELTERALDDVLAGPYALLALKRDGRLSRDLLCRPASEPLPDAIRERMGIEPILPLPAADDRSLASWLDDFECLSVAHAPGYTDEPFRAALDAMLRKLRSLPDYRALARRHLARYRDEVEAFPEPAMIQSILTTFFERFERAKTALSDLRKMPHYERLCDLSETSRRLVDLRATTEAAERLIATLDAIDPEDPTCFDRIVAAGADLHDVPVPSRQGGRNVGKTKEANDYVELFLTDVYPLFIFLNDRITVGDSKREDYFPDVSAVMTRPLDDMKDDLRRTVGPVSCFIELVLALDSHLNELKFRRNVVEFSDLEQAAHALLRRDDICREWRDRFDEIYIDEYQDTSSIQQAIIERLAARNLFLVGDVKQSIYRFRFANPDLFRERVRHSEPYETDTASDASDFVIYLKHNFRSDPRILAFINDFFGTFLTEEAGEIDYDHTQELMPGRSEPETPFPAVSRLVLTRSDKMSELLEAFGPDYADMTDEMALTGCLIASNIHELADAGRSLSEIAVLAPTNDHCRRLRDTLERWGIPVTGTFGGIYPENLVMRQITALLQVLDNPRQDIPLATLLASPLAGEPWTPAEMLRVRREADERAREAGEEAPTFHAAVLAFMDASAASAHSDEDPLCRKASALRERLNTWRLLASEQSCANLLSHVVAATAYDDLLIHSRYGARRRDELAHILNFVRKAEAGGDEGLRPLIRLLTRMKQRDLFPTDTELCSDEEAVRVLTYHKSKGLEWEVVFLTGLGYRQCRTDNALIDLYEHEGLRCYSLASDGLAVYNNYLNEAKQQREARRDLAESWRRLYVGMTRAKASLIFVSVTNKADPAEDSLRRRTVARCERARHRMTPSDRRIPADVSTQCRRFDEILDLYRYWTETISQTRQNAPLYATELWPADRVVDTLREHLRDVEVGAGPDERPADTPEVDGEAAARLAAQLSAPVPHREAAKIPAKITVSEMKRRHDEHAPEWSVGDRTDEAHTEQAISLDRLRSEGGLSDMALTLRLPVSETEERSGAALGTLLHTAFQFLDPAPFTDLPDDACEAEAARQLDAMVVDERITPRESETLRPFLSNLAAFAVSSLGRRLSAIEASTGRVYREIPFTLALPSAELSPSYSDESVTLLQGMIDLWFTDDDGEAVLIDFKSDRLPETGAEAILRDRYLVQLRAYARAIEKATGRKVKARYIWLIRQNRAYRIDA